MDNWQELIRLFSIMVLCLLVLVATRKYFERLANTKQLLVKRLRAQNQGTNVFICTDAEYLGDGRNQLFGNPYGSPITPGMKLFIKGKEVVIAEVYAEDNTPDKPDARLTEGMQNATIVIPGQEVDLSQIHLALKRDGALAIQVTS